MAGLLWIGLSDLSLAVSGELTSIGFRVSAGKGALFVILSTGLVYWLCRREYSHLFQSITLLRAVVEGTSDAVFVKDKLGKYLLLNSAGAQFIGKPVHEVLGRDDRELFDAPEGEALILNDRKIMEGGQVVTREETLTSAGITRTYQATKAPYFNANGSVAGLIGISRNVTDRAQVEAALRETDARLREAQRIAKLGSWSWEPQLDRVWWSEAEFELFGIHPTDLRPSFDAFLSLLHPDDRKIAMERVEAMLAGPKSSRVTFASFATMARVFGYTVERVQLEMNPGKSFASKGRIRTSPHNISLAKRPPKAKDDYRLPWKSLNLES